MSNEPKVPMVQIFTPDGQLADIPYDRLHDALAAGGKIGAKVRTPDGQTAFVPGDRVNDALKAGATRIPLDGNDADGGKAGFWSQAWDKFKSQIPSNLDEAGRALGAASYDPTQTAGGRAASEYVRSRQAGSGIGRSALNAIGTTVGVDPAQEEAQAVAGNTAGVAADAAVPIAETLLGYGAHLAAPAVAERLPTAQAAKDAVGTALRTPEGKLIPPVKYGAKVAGAAAGHALGVPGAGELGGYLVGDKLMDAIIPDRPDAATAAQRRAVPVTKNPTPGGYTGPASARAAAQAAAAAEVSPIVTSQSPEIPSEGRPATWRNMTVSDLARQGGPLSFDAARQAQLRQLDVPNVGLVADPRATVGGAGLGSSAERLARLREIAGYPTLPGGPGDFTAGRNITLSGGEDLGPGLGTEHTIHNADGTRIGSVTVEPKGDGVLHVHWLGGDLAGNASRADIIDSLKKEYPGTEKITYDRRRLAKGADAATTEPREMTLSGS